MKMKNTLIALTYAGLLALIVLCAVPIYEGTIAGNVEFLREQRVAENYCAAYFPNLQVEYCAQHLIARKLYGHPNPF